MYEPKPDNVRPIYGGTLDSLKLYINGKEVGEEEGVMKNDRP